MMFFRKIDGFLKRAKRRFPKPSKRVTVSLILVGVLLASWIFGTGLTFVSPRTVKVTNQPISFSHGEIRYRIAPHINESSFPQIVWKWPAMPQFEIKKKDIYIVVPQITISPMFNIPVLNIFGLPRWDFQELIVPLFYPGIERSPMGQTNEVINLEDLNFERKMVIYSMDRETGNPEDADRILSAVIKGKLEIKNWEFFLLSYNFREYNTFLEAQNIDFRLRSTLDYWELGLQDAALTMVYYQGRALLQAGEDRYSYVRSLIEENPSLANPQAAERYIKENEPWAWFFGPKTVEAFRQYPSQVKYYAEQKVEGALELYQIIICMNFIEWVDQYLPELQEEIDIYERIVRPHLIEEAAALFDEFQRDLAKDNLELGMLEGEGILELRVKKLLEKQQGISEDGKLVFSRLITFKWEKAKFLRQKQAAEIIQRETIEKIKSLPGFNDEINTLYWELIIKATFDNPDVDEEQLGKYLQECVNCPFLRDSRLWERTEEALSKGVMSFSWEIKDLSIEIKEVPLFIDGEVDPDFYPFWLQNKDKYEKK